MAVPRGQTSTPDEPFGNRTMVYIRDVVLPYQSDACLIWPFNRERNGYGRFGRDGKMIYAHRYICEWVNGAAPESHYQVAHSCGRGADGCVNLRHMRWATPSENERDGRRRPSLIGLKKATEIRALKGLLPEHKIAVVFGISERTVRRIHQGEIWTKTEKANGHPMVA